MENNEQKMITEEGNSDFYSYDTPVSREILELLKQESKRDEEKVIYGVYDNSNKGIFTKINDFLIDNTRISVKDKANLYHLLGIMVDAGIPVVKAVETLAGHSDNPRLRRILNTIAHNCSAGATLTDAMVRFEDVFDESELGIIKAGEAAGRLNTMLKKLADQLEKRNELNSKLWGAAIYPISVFVVLIAVSIGMLVWILPTLLSLFKEGGVSNSNLPTMTRILIVIQGVLVNYWWLIVLFIFAGYAIFQMYKSTDRGAFMLDYYKLKFPLAGILLRKIYVLRFVGILGLLIESGLPVMKSLKIAGNSITNRVYKLKILQTMGEVQAGKKISESLMDMDFLFPMEVVQMLNIGEKSANLANISEKISEQYQREVDNSLRKMISIFEPVMILVVGVFVALLALAIMAPIFNLNTIVTK
ncbi:MAG: type II secretion system F family protein [Candidatus Gracilibacteria bacterium]|jgi:type IV pilus assembly protein PilC